MEEKIKNALEPHIEEAKKTILRGEEYPANLVQLYEDRQNKKIIPVILPAHMFMKTDIGKDIMVQASKSLAIHNTKHKRVDLLCVCLITEMFLSLQEMKEWDEVGVPPKNPDDYIQPSKDPNRIDLLGACVCMKDSTEFLHYEFERTDGKGIFPEEQKLPENGFGYMGRMFNLYPKDL